MDRTTVASNLKALRLKKNMTQAEVAKELGISVGAWGMYETGQRIPRDELKVKIGEYFNRSVQNIFFR